MVNFELVPSLRFELRSTRVRAECNGPLYDDGKKSGFRSRAGTPERPTTILLHAEVFCKRFYMRLETRLWRPP